MVRLLINGWRGVAFSGKMGAGKTTTMQELSNLLRKKGYLVKTVSFAEPVKEVAHKILMANGEDVSGDWKVRHRKTLQALGDGLRQHNENVWVDIARKKIDDAEEFLVNDDTRYNNEAKMLATKGFFIVRLNASVEERGDRIILGEQTHKSETDLDDFKHFDLEIDTEKFTQLDIAEIVYEALFDKIEGPVMGGLE